MERFEDFDEEELLDFARLSKEEREALVREHNASLLASEDIKQRIDEIEAEAAELESIAKNGEEAAEIKETGRLESKVDMAIPEVRRQQIRTKEVLRALIDREYPTLREKKDFEKRLAEADTHLDILRDYGPLDRLPYGEPTRIARKLGVDSQTIRNWASKKMTPRLYTYMEWATPKSKAEAKVEDLFKESNGIRNMEDVQSRLDTYYFGDAERESKFYKRELKKAEKYYRFLEAYRKGGMTNEIARSVDLSESGAREYLDGRRPWLVRLASQIPFCSPDDGKVWIPISTTGYGVRENFIQISPDVSCYNDLLDTIRQLPSLDNILMAQLKREFGDVSKKEAFMYLLGIFVSDGGVATSSTSSLGLILTLSKKYSWSKTIGKAACYYFGKIGILCEKKADQKRSSDVYHGRLIERDTKHVWRTEASPINRWIWNSVLGYSDELPKTQQVISADWIVDTPRVLRLAFLQGLADGDGSASPKGMYVCITSKKNQEFIQKLFSSLSIESRITGTDVVPRGYGEMKKAARLPLFRFADERLKASQKIVDMIDVRRDIRKNPVTEEEILFMVAKSREKLSTYDISLAVYEKFGTSIDRRTIRKLVEKEKK